MFFFYFLFDELCCLTTNNKMKMTLIGVRSCDKDLAGRTSSILHKSNPGFSFYILKSPKTNLHSGNITLMDALSQNKYFFLLYCMQYVSFYFLSLMNVDENNLCITLNSFRCSVCVCVCV